MSKTNTQLHLSRLILLLVLLAGLGYLIASHIQTSWNIILAVLGFSAVVFIHECGHFFVAKACNIKVEVFSIFIPPVFLGCRRTKQGWRIRLLPQFFPKDDDPEGDGLLSFTVGKPGSDGETEYRIGLIPVAGYVKMLGQDDIGADKQVTDSRSFGNKSVSARMAVIAAGVTFNVIAALVIMTGIYMVGINRIPAVVGQVIPDSPASRAGLEMGDRIIAIGNKSKDLEFEDIPIAAALSNRGEAVPLLVQRRDGSELAISLVAEEMPFVPVRLFGLYQAPRSLQVMNIKDDQQLFDLTGLRSRDRIVGVNGERIEHYWQLNDRIRTAETSILTLTVERQTQKEGPVETHQVDLSLSLTQVQGGTGTDKAALHHIVSMVPRLRVFHLNDKEPTEAAQNLLDGDTIVAAANVAYPTYTELREITTAHADQDLILKVARTHATGPEEILDVTVHPQREPGTDRVVIGIGVDLDANHPVVAQTLDVEGVPSLTLPRGATLTQIAGQPVTNFYDVMRLLRSNTGQPIPIDYQDPNGTPGQVTLAALATDDFITATPMLAVDIPLQPLQDLHKADHLGEAVVMASKKCVWFILQTYVTLKQLFARGVELKAMSGPVGIATIAYQAVKTSTTDFLYLLAFISANLAVVNFLPIPVVDGGVFVLLIVEKIQGRPLSLRVQEIITYAGLALILSLFVYLTYNDIVRLIG